MITLAQATADLIAAPRPILFMDTCTLLDMVRAPLRDLAADAAHRGARLAVFPEAFVSAYPKGPGFGARMGTYSGLLANESVQKELKLDDKQVEKAKELDEKMNEEMRGKFQDLQDLEPQERRTKMQEINREISASALKSAGEFLKPEQIARLKQIACQVRGAQAFSDTEVAKKLNLTDAQKKQWKEMLGPPFELGD